ncbi:glycine cleavage T-C-terminal barrel domain containing protein [Nitzschia inconspicua]|uniref:Glycine cleavage T-C-terminal barrel domain containing protein n=1 Tax=Nitzschia inconspicua TaxID=303405 RepID=A0A9K3KCR2_9STRA|nr:glycine cleavage T-C-terminal barrel domain containing protein [Nitzschia inconspicua]
MVLPFSTTTQGTLSSSCWLESFRSHDFSSTGRHGSPQGKRHFTDTLIVRLPKECTVRPFSTSSEGLATTTLAGNFGQLWKQGHENLTTESLSQRRILSVEGPGATNYLQSLVTCDLTQPPRPPREEEEWDTTAAPSGQEDDISPGVEFSDKLRAACFLDNKGRILTDALLWKIDETHYYIDVPSDTAEILLNHLKQFILRRTKVKVTDESSNMGLHVVFGTLNAKGAPEGYLTGVDPRHPSLGMRVLSLNKHQTDFGRRMSGQFPEMPGTYDLIRHLAGVAEGMELKDKVAAEANQEFLNAVSFSKGCYLGQELTARVQYTGAVRKRIMPLLMINVNMQVPRPWLLASQIQSKLSATQSSADKEDVKGDDLKDSSMSPDMPRLPRMSASAIASMVAMMSGSVPTGPEQDRNDQIVISDLEEMHAQSQALFDELQTYNAGDKIYDSKDGKTIGQIVAKPVEGTNVLLAQMRLDRVGLLVTTRSSTSTWSHTNKVTIGETFGSGGVSQLRYLPYLPLWWPPIDPESGKAKS